MVFDDINDIPKHYPDVDVALFHLGGTTVLGIVVTMDAKEGLEMFRIINPKKVISIHYNDYDVFKSSLEEFQQKLETQLWNIKCITCTMEKHTTSN
jgi:L-ascorbate metabolism protein UlaG (beta-lactamase superfamily)